jgi:Zn-dependent oligopeptidase
MQYAANRALRETMYRAYGDARQRIRPAGAGQHRLMRELLALRQEEAALLGHASFADLSLVAKMARSPQEVLAFVRDLARARGPLPSENWPNCATSPRANWACPTCRPGTAPTWRKSSSRRATPSAARR